MPYSSISRLEFNPSSFSTSTSTHNPWQSNPFWSALVVPLHGLEPLVHILVCPAPGVVDAHRVVGRNRARRGMTTAARRPSGRAGARTCAARATSRGWRALAQGSLDGLGRAGRATASGGRDTETRSAPARRADADGLSDGPNRATASMIRPWCTPDRPSGRPSPFAAASASALIFPGLGHVYARRYARALGFATLPILGLALLAGLLTSAPTPGHDQGERLRPHPSSTASSPSTRSRVPVPPRRPGRCLSPRRGRDDGGRADGSVGLACRWRRCRSPASSELRS